MHPEVMKHKASLWDGKVGASHHITDVYWEGDITQQELADVADQISHNWQTLELELDPAHPQHGTTYRLHKTWNDPVEEAFSLGAHIVEDELEGHYVWVHCCKHVPDPAGELEDASRETYRQVFQTVMFCTEFTSFDDIADLCDEHFGMDAWDEYEIYRDDDLPPPIGSYS